MAIVIMKIITITVTNFCTIVNNSLVSYKTHFVKTTDQPTTYHPTNQPPTTNQLTTYQKEILEPDKIYDFKENTQFIFSSNPQKSSLNVCLMKT